MLFDEVARLGGKPVMAAPGTHHQSMMADSGTLAGEMSSHVFFADGYYGLTTQFTPLPV